MGILGTQFCLELCFGVLFATAFVPKAPVGVLFYRVMGTAALVLALAAVGFPLSSGELSWSHPIVLGAGVAIVCYPFYSGPVRGRRWGAAMGASLVGVVVAVALALRLARPELSGLGLLLATGTALAGGAVAGSVGLAMVLGHWYLTVPNLAVKHLQRLNRVTIGCMLATIALLGLSLWVFRGELGAGDSPLFGPTGLFYLGTRVAVGLVFPLGFAAMAASSLRFSNTRSATGILYASTVLVLIGAAVSVSLQDSYGVPL